MVNEQTNGIWRDTANAKEKLDNFLLAPDVYSSPRFRENQYGAE